MSLNRFFHEPRENGLAYGFLRIVFGTTAVLWLISLYPFLGLFFGAEGVCPLSSLSLSPAMVTGLWWIGLTTALLMTAGLFIRPVSILLFASLAFFFRTPCRPDNYGDQIFVSLAFLMMFCPSRDPLSLDARLFGRRTNGASPWLHKVLRLYVGTLYLAPVFRRLWGIHWWDGTASWIALADPSTSRVWEFLSRNPFDVPTWVFFAITYSSLAYEGLFPFLIWFRRLRLPLVIAGIVFHTAMGLVMDLGLFPLQMMTILIGCLDDRSIWLRAAVTERPSDRAIPEPHPRV